jgi:competence protein ComEA
MKKLKALIMVTFGFSRSEARAFIILLPLVFLIVFSEPVYRAWSLSGKPDDFDDARKLDSLVATWDWDVPNVENVDDEAALFHFNPNNVSLAGMDSLGIPTHVGLRIERYRLKGGKFRIRSDLRKMYGFDSILYVRLEPFIDLPARLPKKEWPALPSTTSKPRPPVARFDLNTADTAVLNTVYGIGPALAKRIVTYRERLGGFVLPEQLYEVWGLDSIVVQRTLAISEISWTFVPRAININKATEAELASHPYIRGKSARLIVTYRFQHGDFASIGDLEKINLIDSKTFNRIKPYLTLE